MQFTKPMTDIIKQRISVRTYTQRPLEPQKEATLKAFLTANSTGPFQTRLRFELVTAKPGDSETLKKLGTYGQIKHPAGFIIGAMGTGPKNLEDFGYVMEQFILRATDLGLGTCWISGSFRASSFAQAIHVQPDETVPAAASIGNPADTPSWRDRFIHVVFDTKHRFLWEQIFFKGNFATPLAQTEAGPYATPLAMVRLAPSASNKQPWRIIKDATHDTFHFYVQRTSDYKRNRKGSFNLADWQHCDIGIAMCHFELTAREQGLQGTWQITDPGLPSLPAKTEYIVSWNTVA